MMRTARNILVQAGGGEGGVAGPIEICEHKGVGHPDTLTDGACEAAACALAAAYRRVCGQVLHFNVDKGLLVAGRSAPRFGGGQLLEPVKLIVCGRAAPIAQDVEAGPIVVAAATDFLRRTVRADPGMFQVVAEIKPGSANLDRVHARARAVANDTSFGVGYAPYSELERLVLDTAARLRSDAFRARFPAAGDDFKIMGLRMGDGLRLTVALALVDRHVASVRQYVETRGAIVACLARELPPNCGLALNCLDQADATDERGLYLTVSGLSAEMGDDGQVGRGNRVNGLITPYRPMSLEAAAGKNPVAHVGKIYNVLAHLMARDIVARITGVASAEVRLLSTIGLPLDQPQVAHVAVTPASGLNDAARRAIMAVVDGWFERLDEVTLELAHGRIAVY